jgi:hypothetical protein
MRKKDQDWFFFLLSHKEDTVFVSAKDLKDLHFLSSYFTRSNCTEDFVLENEVSCRTITVKKFPN